MGWTQCEGGPRTEIRAGDVVWRLCRKRHWHGAALTTAMSHLAITETTRVVPPSEALRAFDAVTRPLLQKVATHQQQARSLATLRDALLPRLISGQLGPPDVEQIAEAAA